VVIPLPYGRGSAGVFCGGFFGGISLRLGCCGAWQLKRSPETGWISAVVSVVSAVAIVQRRVPQE